MLADRTVSAVSARICSSITGISLITASILLSKSESVSESSWISTMSVKRTYFFYIKILLKSLLMGLIARLYKHLSNIEMYYQDIYQNLCLSNHLIYQDFCLPKMKCIYMICNKIFAYRTIKSIILSIRTSTFH